MRSTSACTVAREDRKVYAITEAGQRDLAEHALDVSEFYDGHDASHGPEHTEDVVNVMWRLGRVVRLFKRGMRRGSVRPSTMRKMHTILDEALKRLEELLSREEP